VSIDGSAPLCFESKSWQECVTQTIQLKKVFRQADSSFAGMLEQIRWGKCSDEALAKLKSRKVSGGVGSSDGGIVATKLMTHKKDVDQVLSLDPES
jgi:ATP-dependent DNA helicase PIF1